MILYPAIRNLLRNRKNSILIISLLTSVTLLFFLGNTLLVEIDAGMERSYVHNYTGHLVVKGRSDVSFSLFGANKPSIGEFFPIPILKNTEKIIEIVEQKDSVESFVSQVSGQAVLDVSGRRYAVPLFGIAHDEYLDFFHGLHIIDGAIPEKGSQGALLSRSMADRFFNETGEELEIGEPLLFTSTGTTGFKIREIPLAGIYDYESGDPAVSELVLADVQTVRALNSISLGTSEEISDDSSAFSIDDLFSEEDMSVDEDESFSLEELLSPLGDSTAATYDARRGGWNFLLLKVNEGFSPADVEKDLNEVFSRSELDCEVVSWREAAGMNALMIRSIQLLFNGGFILIVIAGIIAIVNILVISIYERTGEIGTLRAIGATSAYIKGLLIIENLILAIVSALLAVAVGWLLLILINSSGIEVTNSVLQSLLGSRILNLSTHISVTAFSFLASVAIGMLSLTVPLKMAFKIKPVTAMAKG